MSRSPGFPGDDTTSGGASSGRERQASEGPRYEVADRDSGGDSEAAAADRAQPTGQAIDLAGIGDSARRSGTGEGVARQPEPLSALASIAAASRAVRIGGRETVFLNEGCHGASIGWLEVPAVADGATPPAGDGPAPDSPDAVAGKAALQVMTVEDLDAEPKTFTLDVHGIGLGTRALALDCDDPLAGDLELLVYHQTMSGPAGLATVALVATIGLGATAAVLGTSVMAGVPPTRRRRAGGPPPWFPHDPVPVESNTLPRPTSAR